MAVRIGSGAALGWAIGRQSVAGARRLIGLAGVVHGAPGMAGHGGSAGEPGERRPLRRLGLDPAHSPSPRSLAGRRGGDAGGRRAGCRRRGPRPRRASRQGRRRRSRRARAATRIRWACATAQASRSARLGRGGSRCPSPGPPGPERSRSRSTSSRRASAGGRASLWVPQASAAGPRSSCPGDGAASPAWPSPCSSSRRRRGRTPRSSGRVPRAAPRSPPLRTASSSGSTRPSSRDSRAPRCGTRPAQQVDLRDARVEPEDPKRLTVGLTPLPRGSYRVRFRVLSVDGHVMRERVPVHAAPVGRRRPRRRASARGSRQARDRSQPSRARIEERHDRHARSEHPAPSSGGRR